MKKKKKKRWQIKIDNEHLKNINKIEKYRKLNMTEHKTDMNITKTEKCKKSWTALPWQSIKQTWTLLKNWAALLWQNTKHNTTTLWWTKQRSNKP